MDAKTIAQETVDSMPTPSPVADKAVEGGLDAPGRPADPTAPTDRSPIETPQAASTGDDGPVVRDTKGNVFDPAIHIAQDRRNKDGSFTRRKGGAAQKYARDHGAATPGQAPKPSAVKVDSRQAAIAAGKATAESMFMICTVLGGPDWQPIVEPEKGVDERRILSDAWANYYLAVGITDVPPWVQLSIVCASYALPRLAKPETRSRLARFTDWIRGKTRGSAQAEQGRTNPDPLRMPAEKQTRTNDHGA